MDICCDFFSSFDDDLLVIIMCICHSNDERLETREKTIRKTTLLLKKKLTET